MLDGQSRELFWHRGDDSSGFSIFLQVIGGVVMLSWLWGDCLLSTPPHPHCPRLLPVVCSHCSHRTASRTSVRAQKPKDRDSSFGSNTGVLTESPGSDERHTLRGREGTHVTAAFPISRAFQSLPEPSRTFRVKLCNSLMKPLLHTSGIRNSHLASLVAGKECFGD